MELAQRMGVDAAHLGRVESGKRPPTENLAAKCDEVFPERQGWFSDFYAESRHWPEVPATFKSWPEYEDKAASLRVWSPSIIHGLLQTEAYARALISVQPAIIQEIVSARLASRMERQKRVMGRDNPPSAWFVVDELSLYREVGSADVMAAQLRHLLEVAAMPTVTVQVIPAVAHAVNASGFLMADDAVWIEHAAGGFVYTEKEVVSGIALRFDSLRGELQSVRVAGAHRKAGRHMEGWRKSSYSDGNGGDCVETASGSGVILVRDTTNRDGGTLELSAEAWQAFVSSLR
jgi:transcriptional regulator with XRE-family HTH domain